jgi:hypothetical protein
MNKTAPTGTFVACALNLARKPLLTAATLVFSITAISGSTSAFAGTVIAEGVWNSSMGRFEFYDDNFTGAYSPFFASFAIADNGGVITSGLEIAIKNPSFIDPNAAKIEHHYANTLGMGFIDHLNYSRYEYREGIKYQGEEFLYEQGSYSHTVIKDGVSVTNHEPFNVNEVKTEAYSALPLSGVGIFDFNQSFIHYSENGVSKSISLAEIFSEAVAKDDLYGFNFKTLDNVFSVFAGSPLHFLNDSDGVSGFAFGATNVFGEITGMSLAFNPTPVPEPETWAMLLAGLGIVGAISKRRHRQG